VPDKEKPAALFDLEWFIEITILAFLEDQPQILQSNEMCQTLIDRELMDWITELTWSTDPLDWPQDYELNDNLVLESKDTGWIWVLPNEQLQGEVLATYHDGKIVGDLGTEGTLELVTQKYWWKDVIKFTRCYIQGCHTCA